ncbi:MAG: MOSC domain-containing protein [Paracoccaceae bacterium]
MTEPLAGLIARHAGPGKIEAILVRPARRARPEPRAAAGLTVSGLDGDRARPGKRALTLIQAEHLPAIRALARAPSADFPDLRRNLVVSGLNLAALRGRTLALGPEARIRVTGVCAPCSRMEEALGPGGYAAMRGHGGVTAEVLTPGPIALGDPVRPPEEPPCAP